MWQVALSRELALIQGPPGTGKTFVGIQLVKALLANTTGNARAPTSLDDPPEEESGWLGGEPVNDLGPCIGPVLILCFTNHALDQFLEGLLAAGLTDMVRVGGRYPTTLCVFVRNFSLGSILKSCTEGWLQVKLLKVHNRNWILRNL